MAKKLTVNKDACIMCGACVAVAPEALDFDAEGKAEVIGEVADEAVADVIATCPVGTIEE